MARNTLIFTLSILAHAAAAYSQTSNSLNGNQPAFTNQPTTPSPQTGTTYPSFQTQSFTTLSPIFGIEAEAPTSTTSGGNITINPTAGSTATTPGYSFPQNSSSTGVTTQGVSQGSLLQQVYPEPAKPNPTATQPANQKSTPLRLRNLPLETVAPPDFLIPGLATIKDGKWMISDFFYNLPFNIGVKVEVFKPSEKYVPIVEKQLEDRVKGILQGVGVITDALLTPCQPPLPMYHVLIMAYPCDKRCIGFVTIQLYENARPSRVKEDINGVWQVVTWERQELVASSCDNFSHDVGEIVDKMTTSFADRFKYYHPAEQTPCFNVR